MTATVAVPESLLGEGTFIDDAAPSVDHITHVGQGNRVRSGGEVKRGALVLTGVMSIDHVGSEGSRVAVNSVET